MAAIKDLFQRLKLKTKFKQAGPGVKLSSAASPALSPRAQQPPAASARPASAAGGGGARALTSEQSRAAEAAAQRAAATPRGVPTAKTTAFDRLHEEAYEAAAAQQQQQPLQWLQQREGGAAAADAGASDRLPLEVNIRYTCELLPGEKLDKREMQARIEEYLGAQLAGEAPAMAASLIVRTLNKDAERVSDCIETILKYIDNVLSHPGDEKYTKIRVSNRAFQERVASQKGAVEFLQCAGFELRKCLPVAATSAQPSQAVEEEDHFVLPASIAASPEHLAGLKEVLASAEPVRPQLDPDVRLYRAPHSAATSRFRELPADFFRLSEDEIRREQQARVEALEKAGMLRTRAMRERDERRELSRYRYAVVRVRLPGGDGGLVLQALLHASDRLQALRDVVAGCLRYDWLPFRLTTSGGGELADAERTLAELQLAPASVVNMLLDAAVLTDAAAQLSVGAVEPGDILRPELLDSVGTLR